MVINDELLLYPYVGGFRLCRTIGYEPQERDHDDRRYGSVSGQPVSDAVLDVKRVCRDGIRFRYGAQLDLPAYSRLRPVLGDKQSLPTLYRLIQAASPPPNRPNKPLDNRLWEDGLVVNNKEPFNPNGNNWTPGQVSAQPGIPSLGPPKPYTIVLDKWLTLPVWRGQMPLREGPQLGFPSVGYLQLKGDKVGVNYCGKYTCDWDRQLKVGDWVAISFDRFWPQERDSVDYIVQVRECTDKTCIRRGTGESEDATPDDRPPG
jgi:hypothetical protein